MSSTIIIIPTRLQAKRLPNKPLELIKKKEMILHVHDLAVESGVGDVLVATPDKIISQLILKHGGKSFVSKNTHQTGTNHKNSKSWSFKHAERINHKKPSPLNRLTFHRSRSIR